MGTFCENWYMLVQHNEVVVCIINTKLLLYEERKEKKYMNKKSMHTSHLDIIALYVHANMQRLFQIR